MCSDGKCLACTYRAKFVEVSVGINHNVDELLAGTLTQIRLKKEQNALQVSENAAVIWSLVKRLSFCFDEQTSSKRLRIADDEPFLFILFIFCF